MSSDLLTPFFGIVVSAILAISSWFVIAYYNRKHEIFKKVLDLRIQTFIEALEFFNILQELTESQEWDKHALWNRYKELDLKIIRSLKICGDKDELDIYIQFVKAFNETKAKTDIHMSNPNNQTEQDRKDSLIKTNSIFHSLQKYFLKNLRGELRLTELDISSYS